MAHRAKPEVWGKIKVSKDRKKSLKMTLSTMGRINKSDIVESFQTPLNSSTILCSDGHVSYKGYSKDHNLKHIVLRSDLKQFVKKGVYHIQHAQQIKKVDWWYFLGSINKISAKLPQLVLLA